MTTRGDGAQRAGRAGSTITGSRTAAEEMSGATGAMMLDNGLPIAGGGHRMTNAAIARQQSPLPVSSRSAQRCRDLLSLQRGPLRRIASELVKCRTA